MSSAAFTWERRRFQIDARCLGGEPVHGAWAHVCALPDEGARIQYDQPEAQQVRRDALAWWIPLLGDDLVCLSTLALDEVYCGGAITVARSPRLFDQDPFARLFPGTVIRSDVFSVVAAPAGPVLERYAGAPWPGGRFPGSQVPGS
ncbi:MAG: hypothetical protein M3459_08535 [Actinomycetota bacterium]|nr:hypothetical protein [Actinomycetota bacterium]